MSGYPDPNLSNFVTGWDVDLDFLYFISIRDPDLLGAGGLANPRLLVAAVFFNYWQSVNFIVAWLDEYPLFLPLVVGGLDKYPLGSGLVLSGDPLAGRGVLQKEPS